MSSVVEGQGRKPAWQGNLASPSQRVAALLHSSKLSDLTITLPGLQNPIKAHRLILAMSSPVFEAMLYGPLAEGPEVTLKEDHP
ncbi:hypothetical protein O3P69_010343 [Scylla paramamosain]|uniref:BTB domain-containing protein n=2 Tax=Scylla paramamosain TaxID=85552 RepID=A0AAW0TVG8_SCYPA